MMYQADICYVKVIYGVGFDCSQKFESSTVSDLITFDNG